MDRRTISFLHASVVIPSIAGVMSFVDLASQPSYYVRPRLEPSPFARSDDLALPRYREARRRWYGCGLQSGRHSTRALCRPKVSARRRRPGLTGPRTLSTGSARCLCPESSQYLHNIAIPFTVTSLKHVSTRRQDLARHFDRTAECHNSFLVPCIRLSNWCSYECD